MDLHTEIAGTELDKCVQSMGRWRPLLGRSQAEMIRLFGVRWHLLPKLPRYMGSQILDSRVQRRQLMQQVRDTGWSASWASFADQCIFAGDTSRAARALRVAAMGVSISDPLWHELHGRARGIYLQRTDLYKPLVRDIPGFDGWPVLVEMPRMDPTSAVIIFAGHGHAKEQYHRFSQALLAQGCMVVRADAPLLLDGRVTKYPGAVVKVLEEDLRRIGCAAHLVGRCIGGSLALIAAHELRQCDPALAPSSINVISASYDSSMFERRLPLNAVTSLIGKAAYGSRQSRCHALREVALDRLIPESFSCPINAWHGIFDAYIPINQAMLISRLSTECVAPIACKATHALTKYLPEILDSIVDIVHSSPARAPETRQCEAA